MKNAVLHSNFLLIHKYLHNTPLKKWVEQDEDYVDVYHKDWNPLMVVVDQIEQGGYSVEITSTIVIIVDKENGKEIIEEQGNSKIEATYKAVVSFIKWCDLG